MKLIPIYFKPPAILALVATLVWTWGLSQAGWAMLAPAQPEATAEALPNQPYDGRTSDIEKVQMFLHQKIVRQRLLDYGLTEDQIASRLNRLSDEELRQVALKIDQQNPGGDAVGFLVGVLVLGILVLLFIYLLKRV